MMKRNSFIILLAGALLFLPGLARAEILSKDYTSGQLCSCVSNDTDKCLVEMTPEGAKRVSGTCPDNSYSLNDIGYTEGMQNYINRGMGCGGITATTWAGNISKAHAPVNFNCHTPTVEKKCLCKIKAEDKNTNEVVYQCGVLSVSDNQYPDDYGVLQTNPDCKAEFRVSLGSDYCCCKNESSGGSLTAVRSCKRTTASPGMHYLSCSEAIFSGSAIGVQASDPNYPAFPLDNNASCKTYEQETKEATGQSVTGGIDTLKSEAALVLNPMSFKLGSAGVIDLIGRAINALIFIMGSLLLLFYVYAGILWMTSAGNSEKTGKAKQIVVWSTLGIVVVLASYAIVKFVFSIIG